MLDLLAIISHILSFSRLFREPLKTFSKEDALPRGNFVFRHPGLHITRITSAHPSSCTPVPLHMTVPCLLGKQQVFVRWRTKIKNFHSPPLIEIHCMSFIRAAKLLPEYVDDN